MPHTAGMFVRSPEVFKRGRDSCLGGVEPLMAFGFFVIGRRCFRKPLGYDHPGSQLIFDVWWCAWPLPVNPICRGSKLRETLFSLESELGMLW